MTPIRAIVWVGVFGWALCALNFLIAFLRRKPRTMIRFTWALAAAGAGTYLASRLGALPAELRAALDIALAMGGAVCGVALTITAIQTKGRSLA